MVCRDYNTQKENTNKCRKITVWMKDEVWTNSFAQLLTECLKTFSSILKGLFPSNNMWWKNLIFTFFCVLQTFKFSIVAQVLYWRRWENRCDGIQENTTCFQSHHAKQTFYKTFYKFLNNNASILRLKRPNLNTRG